MKRKEFRDRTQVLLSVERDRWKDFIDICDKERKSTSFKFDEMLAEELQKNALGEHTPISVSYGSQEQKPLQMTLDGWTSRIAAIQSIKDMDPHMIENIGLNMVYASRFKKTGIARDLKIL